MNDHMIPELTDQIMAQIRDSATWDERQAAKLRAEAGRIRGDAENLHAQATGLDTAASDADANADLFDARAQLKRQYAAQMEGRPALPTPGTVVPLGGLGLAIGALRMTPRPDASAEELASFRDLMQAIHEQALHQSELARGVLRERQATITTGQISPEDLPQPDALTAAPAQESGAHPIVPATETPVGRPWTPDRKEVRENGKTYTVVKMKRACNGCGKPLGDVTPAEMDAGMAGVPLPDVRSECPACSGRGDVLVEPDADESPEAGRPSSEPKPPKKPTVTAREGAKKIRASLRRNRSDEPHAPYPVQPAGQVDPLQERLDRAAEAMRDPSARQVLPPSHGSDAETQALPVVRQNGNGGGQ